jgi:hypothetical protein
MTRLPENEVRRLRVPLALGFQIYPWVERVLKVRQYPLAPYGLALLLVAVAMLVRTLAGHPRNCAVRPGRLVSRYPAVRC